VLDIVIHNGTTLMILFIHKIELYENKSRTIRNKIILYIVHYGHPDLEEIIKHIEMAEEGIHLIDMRNN
jgi:hypothetical protein